MTVNHLVAGSNPASGATFKKFPIKFNFYTISNRKIMAKKKQTLDFTNDNITFNIKEQSIKVLTLNLNNMNVEVIVTEDEKKKVRKMPFAQLPKEIKKVLRPI